MYFLNLEIQQRSQNTIRNLIVDDREITDQTHILEYIGEFYETVIKKREQRSVVEMGKTFSDVDIPKHSGNIVKLCEKDLIEKDLYNSLKSMQSYKSPCNGVLTNNFYEMFWNKLEEILQIVYQKLKKEDI